MTVSAQKNKAGEHVIPDWKSWGTIDDDGQLRTFGEIGQRFGSTTTMIARQLGETKKQTISQLYEIVKILGPDQAMVLLAETKRIEANGGMLVLSGKRRRTPGGVFLRLARESGLLPPRDWKKKPKKAETA